MIATRRVAEAIRAAAQPLTGAAEDFDPLLDLIDEARLVLIGEASHGTHEFYRTRARITQRLIQEKGFTAVAAEADWPDAYRINRYVRAASADASAVEALADFKRFPAWMWRNPDVLDFVGWLRSVNDARATGRTASGFTASTSTVSTPRSRRYFHARLPDQFDAVLISTRRARWSRSSGTPDGNGGSCQRLFHRRCSR